MTGATHARPGGARLRVRWWYYAVLALFIFWGLPWLILGIDMGELGSVLIPTTHSWETFLFTAATAFSIWGPVLLAPFGVKLIRKEG